MADGKVFTKETKKFLIKVGDKAIKLPFWAEPFDGPGISWLVNFVDKKGDKYIPDEFDPKINSIAIQCGNGNWEAAATEVAILADDKFDVPYVDDAMERELFVNAAKFLVSLVQNFIENRKKKKAAK